jgi:diguanylate cyclase (GGDEF)-like protein
MLETLVFGFYLYSYQRIAYVFGGKVFSVFLSAFALLIIAQCVQIYELEFNQQVDAASKIIYSMVFVLFVIGLFFVFSKSLKEMGENKKFSEREEWFKKIYENISSAVFVKKNDEVIYSNPQFVTLQRSFEAKNPFFEFDQYEQEIWLTTAQSKRHAYSVRTFELDNEAGTVFIVNDITSCKLHESFVKKTGIDLNEHGNNAINLVLESFLQFLPSGLIYVGSYQSDEKRYRYVGHKGQEVGANVYNDLSSILPNLKHNKWSWFNRSELSDFEANNFITESNLEYVGSVILSDAHNYPLGVVVVLLEDKEVMNDLLMDFLLMASVRIRSELEYMHSQKMILKSSHQYRAFISKSNEAIVDVALNPAVVTDLTVEEQLSKIKRSAVIKEINPEFHRLFEISGECEFSEVLAIKSLRHVLNYVLNSGFSSERIEVIHETSYGETKWISCRCMSEIENGLLTRIWLIIQDVTESKMHIQDLEYKTRHDALTGLPNRIAIRDTLNSQIDQALQFGVKVGLLLLDLDRFKEINDALGHHYGDVLLKKIEPRIKPILKKYRASLSRLGGDEFAVIMPSIQSTKEARQLATEIICKIKEPFDLGQLNVEISGSIGISIFPEDGADSGTLLRCADIAMYKAKSSPGGILNYKDNLDDNSPRRLSIMASMGAGLRDGQFYLCYQPKVHLESNSVRSCEALIRWDHPELGVISPVEFIPLAEMNDSIILITEWVIDSALTQIGKWVESGMPIKVSINVSPRNLLDENLIQYLSQKLIEYEVPAHLLEIEITESALMADPDRALETLNKISALGVSISVDDFGTGYSSLVYLRQLPLDTLKVDITFVRNMCNNEQDHIIVNSIIQLAHNLSLTVVAEGAEDLQTVEALKAMKCEDIQGFYFSKPLKVDDFSAFCSNWKS